MSLAARRQTPQLNGAQFALLMEQLQRRAGIRIESPLGVIADCVGERMQTLALESSADYVALFDDSISARAEWLALVDLLTVKETRFFRQPAAMQVVAEYVEDWLGREDTGNGFSFWSAGCSAGHELYSIAMVVEHLLHREEPWLEWHGVGTDISFRAITEAQRGRYHEAAIEHIPAPYRRAYTARVSEREWQMSEGIRTRSHFFHSNLLHVNDAPFSDFNVVFCQNVLIYFERDTQHWIIDQLADRLREGGLLILGAGEDLGWTNPLMQRAGRPGVCAYKKLEV
ncbi:CheR family methyltransferase [Parahaliea mediterranea]|uniref:protein-glutamate O-methyltransferase n=1 Tax=Parahaliea mediterranea TaxID=651086 RepID=A0A939DFK7_9GAMM|nr:protein-glutamate O-methyltransferase CheR [Parahaliea mediterranea]MBN7797139.1 protein-glutamate O-methyltransferase CheR [Parahaliea mediterranea]